VEQAAFDAGVTFRFTVLRLYGQKVLGGMKLILRRIFLDFRTLADLDCDSLALVILSHWAIRSPTPSTHFPAKYTKGFGTLRPAIGVSPRKLQGAMALTVFLLSRSTVNSSGLRS